VDPLSRLNFLASGRVSPAMKVTIKSYHAVAAWKWDTSDQPHKVFKYAGASDDPYGDDDDDDDECGICRLAFESCCPDCKVPGDDCPLSESLCPYNGHAQT